MHTIPEIDEIAKRATERIAKEFAESGFANPPVVTHGIARAVLEAAEQKRYLTCATSHLLKRTRGMAQVKVMFANTAAHAGNANR